MMKSVLLAALLLGASPLALAEAQLLLGHVQRLTLEPSGMPNCPLICPQMVIERADGSRAVCMSRNGACETMDFKVDQVLAGESDAARQFKARSGEFGPFFAAVRGPVLVIEEEGRVGWAAVIERDGKQVIDPRRLWKFKGAAASRPGDADLVDLDEVLARLGVKR
ncbi:hypothetical protein [Massilia aerilata]|uniref:Uncharacterized protein n=1 Tax=Massilia aerilata TaxID=453817 RepID=A0ABW0RXP8_9BURK